MATTLTNLAASALADALDAYVNTGGVGKIIIYGGTVPANAQAASTGTVLVTFDSTHGTVQNPMFGSAASGVITLQGTPLTTPATATGTANHFRIYQNDGTTCVLQGAVGTSGAELNLNTLSITSAVNVTITSGTVTMPTS